LAFILLCVSKDKSQDISNILQTIGKQRNLIKTFLSKYIIPGDSIVVDLTHVFSRSEDIISATLGRNADQDYTPQINLFLLFSLDGRLKVDEEKDFLIRAKDDKDKLNEFYENEKKFGTITIITGTNLGAQKIFELFKIGDDWVLSEIPKKSRLLIEKLGIEKTIT
jgi:hypothetical protein